MYGFNHAFWLNWIILCALFSINPWFKAGFKAVMWITYFSFLSISKASFSTFPTFFLSGRNGKSLWELNKVFGYSISTSRNYPLSLFSLYSFMNLSLNFDNFFTYLKPFIGRFWDIAHPYKFLYLKRLDMMIQCFYLNYSYIYCLL